MSRKLTALLIAAALIAPPAFAQDDDEEAIPGLQTDGGIRFGVAGQSYDYHTVSFLFDTVRVGSASVQAGNESGTGSGDVIGIAAMSEPGGEGSSFHIFVTYEGSPVDGALTGELVAPTLTWFPDGDSQPFWASLSTGTDLPEITFTGFEFNGESGRAAGHFRGRLCHVAEIEATEPDPTNCQDVDGTFDTAIYKAF